MNLESSGEKAPYVWRLIEKSEPIKPIQEYGMCGLIGFDFEDISGANVEMSNERYDFPYLKLLQKLWPGNWQQQLAQMNQWIIRGNKTS